MATTAKRRAVPAKVWKLPLNERLRWARTSAGLSHDKVVTAIGRSNRPYLICLEKGKNRPGVELRNLIADATNVPRELFADEDDEEAHPVSLEDLFDYLVLKAGEYKRASRV